MFLKSPAPECFPPQGVYVLRQRHSVRLFVEGDFARCTRNVFVRGVVLEELIAHFAVGR